MKKALSYSVTEPLYGLLSYIQDDFFEEVVASPLPYPYPKNMSLRMFSSKIISLLTMFLEFIVLIISVNNNMSIFSFFHETYGTFFYSFNWKMFLLALCSIIL